MERDRAKKAKADAKRERRLERGTTPAEPDADAHPAHDTGGRLSEAEVIERLRVLHDRYEDGALGFDDFEEQKAALLERLSVD
jgi:hypothetical protein